MGQRVEIHDTSRADMNGKRGVAVDFHPNHIDVATWRYTVELDSGETFKVKMTNVRAEGASGSGGGGGVGGAGADARAGTARGNSKGTGKKRRGGPRKVKAER